MTPAVGDEVQQRLSAILFADVVNYTGAMEKDQLGTHKRVKRRVDLFRSLIGDYDGRIFDIEGDAVKAAFDSALQAVKFAVDLQREFRDDAVWNSDPAEPVFRIGINLGEVIVEPDGFYGHEVNVTERLQALAKPGGICISESVHRVVRGRLEVGIEPIGARQLKNIAEAIEVFAVDVGRPSTSAVPLPPAPQLPPPDTHEASIVVLPLRNLSGDRSDTHLCEGITSDIITNLSRFRDLLVIARHSAFFYRDGVMDSRDVGQQLGVRYALTGGLQRSGSRLWLNVQLVETHRGAVLWSDRYKGDLADIFAFQDDISGVVASQLAVRISAAERRRMQALPPAEIRAYGLVLRGEDLSLRFRKDANLHARRLFEQAAEVDRDYGRSYAGMSRTFNLTWRYRWVDDPELCLDRAVEFARAAIEHDQLDARGYAELGCAQLYKKQHEAALAAYDRALALNPNDADILAEMADAVCASGNPHRAIELLNRAMRLNPYCPDTYLWFLGGAYFDLSRYDDAIHALNRMQDKSEAHRLLAASHALLGQTDDASSHAAEALVAHPEFSLEHWRSVPPDKNPETLQRFLEGLRLAGLK
ncbi:MAG TPA: tetratricopeptide repeat protein [Methylomirabilota bacterium]|nr:tetratricopeptide repeat protein [Methylomirabilota bacterium]